MRRIVLLLLALTFAACKGPVAYNQSEYPIICEPLNEAWPFVASHAYQEHPGADIKTPDEFDADGGGDCLDFAVNLMYRLGPEASLVTLRLNGGLHAITGYRGEYLEPQHYGAKYLAADLDILQRVDYSRVMYTLARQ